ncbi:unnamed protein product [Echinostoma caproni]|uniref:Secreted protein n=1 Tax=Echinostoma caproni TaxID=27848 RepID=A0A183AL33_9TREM|nr:unnamed protein product [Echinostoma caproni]
MLLVGRMNSDFTQSNLRTAAVAAAAVASALDVLGTSLNNSAFVSCSTNSNNHSLTTTTSAVATVTTDPSYHVTHQTTHLVPSPTCVDRRLLTDPVRAVGHMRAHNLPSDTFRALLDADYIGAEMAEKENMRARFIPFTDTFADPSELVGGLRNGTVGKLEQGSSDKNCTLLRLEPSGHLDVDGYRCKSKCDLSL